MKETIQKTGSRADFFYLLTFIGAAVYFIQRATTFWEGFIGFFKAMAWPAFVIYKVLELLKL